jgi:group II intron reverse transcriptase/maturase
MVCKPLERLSKLYELNLNSAWINKDLYRLVCSPDMLIIAYERIKSKSGNMTPGTDGETLDGFSMSYVTRLADELKSESFQFRPTRRHFIPKRNGKMRPLGIPSPRDKVVQEAIRIILEAIYDSPKSPTFVEESHGFRERRSTHTAIEQVRIKWGAPNWIIEGDIKSFFDEIDPQVLVTLLRNRISDERFINLIQKALSAGYMESDTFVASAVGTPQGSIISPILANIYLHEFDILVKNWIAELSNDVKKRPNPRYRSAIRKRESLLKASDGKVTEEIKSVTRIIRSLPSQDHSDPNSIRVSYVRYADDWIIGITGPRSLAEDLRDRARLFLRESLKLELSMEKTKITNLREGRCRFLGFNISVPSPKESKVSDYQSGELGLLRRVSHGAMVRINLPIDETVSRLSERGFCDSRGFPTHHNAFLALDLDQIVTQYNMVMRGIANYYAACNNFATLNRISYILRYSLAKTLANKDRTSMKEQFRKRGKSLRVVKLIDGIEMSVSFVDFRPLKRKTFTGEITDPNRIIAFHKIRTKSRLGILSCAVKNCTTGKPVEMHHVKHIRKTGKTVSGFTRLMAAVNRKQVPLCEDCHKAVHRGTYDGLALKDLEMSVIYG